MPAFTRKQTKEFFKTTIGCRDDEVIEALEREGIEEVKDLVDFVELDTIKLVLENMRRPVGTMEDPDDSSRRSHVIERRYFCRRLSRILRWNRT